MLLDFIAQHREELIGRARATVAGRRGPRATDAEVANGVPLFLTQLSVILSGARVRGTETEGEPEMGHSAALHGRELLRMGLTIAQVVHAYGDVCQAITELAVEVPEPLNTEDFRTLNRCLDDAIAAAVTEYMQEHEVERNQTQTAQETERLGVLAHELRNRTNTALLAWEALRTGRVGITGGTGVILERSLEGLRALIDSSLAEVRLS